MEQTRYFIDIPGPGQTIRAPKFTVTGWFAVLPATALDNPLLHLRQDMYLALTPQHRPDVFKQFPGYATLGFSGTFPSQLLLDCEEPYVTVQANGTVYRIPLTLATEKQYLQRLELSRRYLSGSGIEIGALQDPLPLPPEASVKYVDRMSVKELRRQYPELKSMRLVDADVIDNGEELAKFSDGSQDFVIANHFLEHCEDTIGALKNMLRVLRSGGVLFLSVPDKRFTFENERPTTTLEHIIADHQQDPAISREQHYQEWVDIFKKDSGAEEKAREKQRLMAMQYSIHYTTWTPSSFFVFLNHLLCDNSCTCIIEHLQQNEKEIISILKKI